MHDEDAIAAARGSHGSVVQAQFGQGRTGGEAEVLDREIVAYWLRVIHGKQQVGEN